MRNELTNELTIDLFKNMTDKDIKKMLPKEAEANWLLLWGSTMAGNDIVGSLEGNRFGMLSINLREQSGQDLEKKHKLIR